nr:hypothetical protein DSAG12_00202 [Candidatus Prometheoarchaeum syntrophicum]
MRDPLPKLHAIELKFHSLTFEFYEEYPDFSKDFILEFIQKTGEYSKELNLSLKAYAKIDYFTNKNAKIAMKALIKFAYDLLSLLASIIRNFESDFQPKDEIDSQFRILDDFIDRKQNLISTSYRQAATQELIAFYDNNLRSSLESQLQKRLENKKSREL